MIQRPKSGENEEDLLKFQQEFLAQQTTSSANVIKRADKRKTEKSDDKRDVVQMETMPSTAPSLEAVPAKKSKFKTAQEAKKFTRKITEEDDLEERLEKHDRHMAAVLTHIIERDTRNATVQLPRHSTQAFPAVSHRGEVGEASSSKPGKKRSLFAQQASLSSGIQDFGVVLQQECERVENISSTSRIVGGTGLSASLAEDEARKIHQENLDRMAALSEEEILEEQKKLLEMMDPKLVEFLTAKRKKSKSADQEMHLTSECTKKVRFSERKNKVEEKPELPIEPNKDWIHMDKIEYDKLAWMKDMPIPVAGNAKTGQQARFDFHGDLIPVDSDIHVTQGLHHHGEEPERAGYTIEELFQLARSSNNQQRTLALQSLARVLQKAKEGAFAEIIQTPILPSVLESGVIFLFRWAMDDSIDSVLSAAVAAMHALLCNEADQECLESVSCWFQGQVAPSYCPDSDDMKKNENEDEKGQETDADIAKRDLIQGLVERMMFLQRLQYILEVRRPQALTVIQILNILSRVARHSAKMAYEIVHCPGLMDFIIAQFLPMSWNPVDTTKPLSDVYGLPLPAALRLVGAISQAGRNMAAVMVSKYQLQNRLFRYLAVRPSELQVHEADSLQFERFRTWRIFLAYGLTSDIYLDLYSTLVQNLQTTQQNLKSGVSSSQNLHTDALMLTCLEAVVSVSSGAETRKMNKSQSQGSGDMETDSMDEVVFSFINWNHVADLIQPVMHCLQWLLSDIKDYYQFKKHDLQFATACINFVASYYKRWESEPSYNAVECLEQIDKFCQEHFLPLWKSFGFQIILRSLSQSSDLLSQNNFRNAEICQCLPELGGSFPVANYQVPVLQTNTPFGFLTACLRLVHVFCKLHKGMIDKVLDVIVDDKDILSYMTRLSQNKRSHLVNNYFTRFENIFQYFVIKLQAMKSSQYMPVFHQCSLHLLTRLHHGDEHLAHDLISTIIFNSQFIIEGKDIEMARQSMSEISISETTHLKSASQEEITVTRGQLLKESHSYLASIRATYITAFGQWEKAVRESRSQFLMIPQEIDTLLTSRIGECLLPQDWIYLPLVELYNRSTMLNSGLPETLPPRLITMATNVLRWVFLLECWRPHVLNTVSITLKISRIMCSFLAGNDLFLDRSVQSYLTVLLREYTKPALLDQMNFEEPIPGLTSFYDLYMDLLQQYEAVSFGDSLFGCYVLVPLQQKHEPLLRKAVWEERVTVLRTLFVPVKEMLVPIQRYLDPDESDTKLLQFYMRCLLSQTVRPQWSPVMYLVAVHHVNRFLYYQHDTHNQALRDVMWKQLAPCNKEVQNHLVYYKKCDPEKDFSMELYRELPPHRQALFDSIRHSGDMSHR